jgi:hypothetical protein
LRILHPGSLCAATDTQGERRMWSLLQIIFVCGIAAAACAPDALADLVAGDAGTELLGADHAEFFLILLRST